MFRLIVVLALTVASASIASAQQQQPSTAIERVSVALGQCIGQGQQQADQISDLQKQLAAAQVRIKELEPQSVPK